MKKNHVAGILDRRTLSILRIIAYREDMLREISNHLRNGHPLTADEAELAALFIDMHAHYPAATLQAIGWLQET